MTKDDRQLFVEVLGEMREFKGEMREFKGEMREFKVGVIDRVEKLERKEGERNKERISVIAIFISALSVVITVIINLFKGGK